MLERWKERKALEKEKGKREKERKGIFRTGIYHPKDFETVVSLPTVPAASTRAKEVNKGGFKKGLDTNQWKCMNKMINVQCLVMLQIKVSTASSQSTRITRSMKQQQQHQQPQRVIFVLSHILTFHFLSPISKMHISFSKTTKAS